jgi:hypothetical protein
MPFTGRKKESQHIKQLQSESMWHTSCSNDWSVRMKPKADKYKP